MKRSQRRSSHKPKKSHRLRRRQRLQRHPDRTYRMQADSDQRQEISRLYHLHLDTRDRASLVQSVALREELDRRRPMPSASQGIKLLNRAKKGAYLPDKRLRKMAVVLTSKRN